MSNSNNRLLKLSLSHTHDYFMTRRKDAEDGKRNELSYCTKKYCMFHFI